MTYGSGTGGIATRLVVVIPTLDEEIHVARAVRSALRLGHVFVVDSGSSDATRRIAAELGAEVVEHQWAGYAEQKNWAIGQVADRFEWVLFLDADEWIPEELADEIRVSLASSATGFHLPRRNVFEGRVLKHAWWYPDYQLRLFRSGKGRFEDRLVHEHVIVEGTASFLRNPLMHENLKGLDAFLSRHGRYAELEAREILKSRAGDGRGQRQGRLAGTWPERRRFIKTRIWYRMPFRPAIRFAWMYIIKRGFLDGRQGRVYCQLIASYEAMIDAQLLELERAAARAAARERPPALELRFTCPGCHAPLEEEASVYACATCGRSYPVIDGIPVFLPDVVVAQQDELDHEHSGRGRRGESQSHKDAQARHFDDVVAVEFEITRPHGTARLYQFLLAEKFRRATAPIRNQLPGASALTVCGGSGMDAEFLALAGARVVSSDISLGAARRTRERALRQGLDITSIVADVESLPFADESVDLVFVHDGIHHLGRPDAGLVEMARVARRWVSVTEPARATATTLAVRLGLALDREEAGNEVVRLSLSQATDLLQAAGFRSLVAKRYAMYYPHQPGPIFRFLSGSVVFPLVRWGWRAGNALVGRAGNKLTLLAERRSPSAAVQAVPGSNRG